MSKLLGLIKALLRLIPSQHERDEAYLAHAVDICDVERRLREIEARDRNASGDITLGFGLR